MRGKVINDDRFLFAGGITPAYAGKRLETASLIVRNQDHPRLCGEKPAAELPLPAAVGSPPPMRGKVVDCAAVIIKVGITPAYAGKSQTA